jgi:hypothetical protein
MVINFCPFVSFTPYPAGNFVCAISLSASAKKSGSPGQAALF